ncbi:MAG: hypothetical protein C4B59_10770 [Candidatus Methanogaster sp.]|uniref:Uncharacterized protein n=1 Tax=Candidatus Methanogaster sp. TaxID=3386292 RepID=A0AC61L1G1_9EURY|nr:MAG: hypothetical protein C4B59_10770 [ANME-2 cluster archaeon]
MRTTVMFLVALLAIIAITTMSGCIDDTSNDAENATGGDARNDTNTTLSNAGDELSGSYDEEPIDESGAKMRTVPEFEPEPEAAPIGHEDPDATVDMNETVNLSGLNVTCTMVKNYHYYDEGTDRRLEVSVRHIKLRVMITATGGEEIETGIADWWIMDTRGRKYKTIPHTDANPMKPVHKLSDGDTINAYLLFDLPGNVTDFVVQYNISNVVSSDCDVISWVVGDPDIPTASEYRNGFVRYPIRAKGSYYHTSNRTWASDDLTFRSDGSVEFKGEHLHGRGTWKLVESNNSCNAYNVSFKDRFYNVNIDVLGSWSSNGCGMGSWNEIQ